MTEYDPCNPATWPAEAKAKISAIEAKERSVAEELRRKRKAYLESLGRVSLADAIEMARAAGKPEPWPWVRAQIQGRKLPAWGTIGHRIDRPFDPGWFDHECLFGDPQLDPRSRLFDDPNDGAIARAPPEEFPKPPADNCIFLEPGNGRPHRVSDIAVDAAALAAALTPIAIGAAIPEPKQAPQRRVHYVGALAQLLAPKNDKFWQKTSDAEIEKQFRESYGERQPPLPHSRYVTMQIRRRRTAPYAASNRQEHITTPNDI